MQPMQQTNPTIAPAWYRAEADRARRIETMVARYLILPAAAIALFRGTQMWFGYPTSQGDNTLNDPFTMQLVLYSIVPLIALATVILPDMAGRALVRLGLPVLLLMGLLLASIVFSVDPLQSARGFIAVMVVTVPMIYLRAQFGAAAAFDIVRRVVATLMVVNFAYAVVFPHYAFMSGSLDGAMRGMFIHKNAFGAYCAVAFVLLVPPDFRLNRWDRLGRLALCALAVVGVALSLSSTAVMLLLTGIAMLATTAILGRIGERGLRGLIFTAALLVTILLLGGAGQILLETVAGQFGKDVTFSGRSEIWEALWPAALDKPWLGHGFAMFRQTSYFQQFVTTIGWGPRSTHNSFLEILLNSGFPVLFLWLGIVVAMIFRGVLLLDPAAHDYRAIQKGLTVIVLVLLVSMSEAAQMMGPQALWPIMVLSLYCIAVAGHEPARRTAPTPRRQPPPLPG